MFLVLQSLHLEKFNLKKSIGYSIWYKTTNFESEFPNHTAMGNNNFHLNQISADPCLFYITKYKVSVNKTYSTQLQQICWKRYTKFVHFMKMCSILVFFNYVFPLFPQYIENLEWKNKNLEFLTTNTLNPEIFFTNVR